MIDTRKKRGALKFFRALGFGHDEEHVCPSIQQVNIAFHLKTIEQWTASSQAINYRLPSSIYLVSAITTYHTIPRLEHCFPY
jgi:hypothetical protein